MAELPVTMLDHEHVPAPWCGQLETGAKTEGADCGPRTLINLMLASSRGKVGPRTAAQQDDWTADVRRWMGKPGNVATTPADLVKAWASSTLSDRFTKAGLYKPKLTRHNDDDQSKILRGISDDRMYGVCVDYGVLRATDAPTASSTFTGGHWIMLTGRASHGEHIDVLDCDPLFDGRRKGIPHGPTVAVFNDFRDAMAKFGEQDPGRGNFDGVSVPMATTR